MTEPTTPAEDQAASDPTSGEPAPTDAPTTPDPAPVEPAPTDPPASHPATSVDPAEPAPASSTPTDTPPGATTGPTLPPGPGDGAARPGPTMGDPNNAPAPEQSQPDPAAQFPTSARVVGADGTYTTRIDDTLELIATELEIEAEVLLAQNAQAIENAARALGFTSSNGGRIIAPGVTLVVPSK